MSHLLQMRGLKRNQPYKHYRPRQVASFTDAWIETYQSAGVFSQCQSHLLQMRGLKRIRKLLRVVLMVASFTDAWIETFFEVSALMFFVVASFTDAWIETPGGIAKKLLRQSHLLQMRGLKRPF